MAQVNKMISGAPASICIAPTSAARRRVLPPSLHARSTSSQSHGAQASAAMLFGHMTAWRVKPLKAKARPPTHAAKRLPVQW